MRKHLFVLALFLTSLAFAQEVKLTHNMPAAASPGQTIDVEFTVTKGNIGAFAKFQCDLPVGYQATNGDSKSGNFTFENNRVKIVWVSLPAEATFSFNFKIAIPATASGAASIGAQFFYLENNVKKEADIPPHSISLGGSGAVTSTPVETTNTPTETQTTPVETTSSTPTETKTTPVETTSTPTETKTTPVETTSTPTETKSSTPTKTSGSARAGVVYYIQVAALSSEPGGQFKKFGKTKVVQENGMYKVLAGSYTTLEEARKHKPDMTSKGADGCFVVAYENGVRIKL